MGTVTGVMQVRPHPFEQQSRPPVQSLSLEHEITQAPKPSPPITGQRVLVGGVEVVVGGGEVVAGGEVVVGGGEVGTGLTQVIPHPLEQQIRPVEQPVLSEH